MTSGLSNTAFGPISSHFERWFKSDVSVYSVCMMAILLSYGYELFNFNLTIDEEIRANQLGMWFDWVAQGRWGMALLNYLLVPNPVVPVTSLFLGLLGLVLGGAALIKSSFNLDRIGLAAIAAVAITIPTLPFSLTFSTLAYGIGGGFVAVSIANRLVYQRDWQSIGLACLLASFAIGIYQTFVFVIAMLVVVQIWRSFTIDRVGVATGIGYPTAFLFGSLVFYWLINWTVLKAMHMDIRYVGQFIDIQGFIHDPIARLASSFRRWGEIISLNPRKFGISSMWLGILVLISYAMVIVYPLIKRDYRNFVWMTANAVTMMLIVVAADAISLNGAPLRSVIYIPAGIAIIAACAYTVSGKIGKYLLILLCLLAVIGNSQVNNHLFASSASAEFRDRMLADAIINEVRKIQPDRSTLTPLKVEIIGNLSWPVTGIQSKTETFGASFFEWDAGNRYRVAAYLGLNGLSAIAASEEDRVRVYAKSRSMPTWPHEGWIAVVDDILILKFSDYSAPQKASLCALKINELCDKP